MKNNKREKLKLDDDVQDERYLKSIDGCDGFDVENGYEKVPQI